MASFSLVLLACGNDAQDGFWQGGVAPMPTARFGAGGAIVNPNLPQPPPVDGLPVAAGGRPATSPASGGAASGGAASGGATSSGGGVEPEAPEPEAAEPVFAQAIACRPYVPVQDPAIPTEADCADYEFYDAPNIQSQRAMGMELQHIQSGPLALAWGSRRQGINSAESAILDQLSVDPELQANVSRSLDELRRRTVERQALRLIPNISPKDGRCYTTTFYVGNSGYVDRTLSGAATATCDGFNNDAARKVPFVEIFPASASAIARQEPSLHQTMAHEYMHTLQCRLGRPSEFPGWDWTVESYANYFGNAVADATHVLSHWQENRHWAVDAFLHRYGVWPFWQFLEKHSCLGTEYVAAPWQRQVNPGESVLEFLRRIAPFDCAAGDEACRDEAWGNLYGEFAVAATTFVPFTEATGLDYWARAKSAGDRLRRWYASTERLANGRYRITDELAPQRLAFNAIQLIRDPAQTTVSVDFSGWPVPARGAEWRVALVALDAGLSPDSGAPTAFEQTEFWKSGRQSVDLTGWEARLGTQIESLLLVVAATPRRLLGDEEMSAFRSPERYREMDRYVYDFSVDGAWPTGHEPSVFREPPLQAGAPHPLGGGFVAQTASVAESVWVGPEARVLEGAQVSGRARILGRATVSGEALVQDEAIVSGTALVTGNATVSGRASVRDNASLSGRAQATDDAVVAGEAILQGTFSLSDDSRLIGAPLTENQRSNQLSGTAIYDGSRWQNGQSRSAGTDYNNWSETNSAVLAHYDFEQPHPYRIRDTHTSLDAYCVDDDGVASPTGCTGPASFGSATVWRGVQGNSLRLPQLLLDLQRLRLSTRLFWSGPFVQAQCILGATTDQGERLALALRPDGGGGQELFFLARDAAGVESEVVIPGVNARAGTWQELQLLLDETNGAVELALIGDGGLADLRQLATLPIELRSLDHDSLRIRLGMCPGLAGSHWLGELDDVTFARVPR